MSIAVAHRGPFTIDDLDHFPDDGLRYELVEGTLLVSATPSLLHQRMVARLLHALEAVYPSDLETLPGPAKVITGPATLFQPDLLVVRPADVHAPRRQVPLPLVVIEVRSPSTRLVDQGLKRLAYRDAGIGAYCMADPFEPSLTVLRWDGDGEHEQFAAGDDVLTIDWPAAVSLQPSALVSDRR